MIGKHHMTDNHASFHDFNLIILVILRFCIILRLNYLRYGSVFKRNTTLFVHLSYHLIKSFCGSLKIVRTV